MYLHLVNADTPNLHLELNAETRLTTLGIDIGQEQPEVEDKERQLFFTKWFSEGEEPDFFDFINSIYIYASYKVYPNDFKILLIDFPEGHHQQIEPNYGLDNEYKLEPDDGEVWAKISAEFIDEIQEDELLEYFNDWFEHYEIESRFDTDDINSDENNKILEFISNSEKSENILTRLDNHMINSNGDDDDDDDMMENKYLKYKLKYLILKNLKNSI